MSTKDFSLTPDELFPNFGALKKFDKILFLVDYFEIADSEYYIRCFAISCTEK